GAGVCAPARESSCPIPSTTQPSRAGAPDSMRSTTRQEGCRLSRGGDRVCEREARLTSRPADDLEDPIATRPRTSTLAALTANSRLRQSASHLVVPNSPPPTPTPDRAARTHPDRNRSPLLLTGQPLHSRSL